MQSSGLQKNMVQTLHNDFGKKWLDYSSSAQYNETNHTSTTVGGRTASLFLTWTFFVKSSKPPNVEATNQIEATTEVMMSSSLHWMHLSVEMSYSRGR